MNERLFKEQCYKHFTNKYKDAVKELDDKHAQGYNKIFTMEKEMEEMRLHIARLEYILIDSEILPEDYMLIRRNK
jgi:uncharacterized protein YhaN